ncbi:uncharacterized protein LOC144065618 isoform X2 [Stigmatopora argus]
MHQTEHQKSAPMKDEDNEEFESIKEEQEEYFITVGKLHIEEQQRPLIKVEEVPLYVKEEGIDVPMCTVEPLRSEDECPSGASSGAEPLSCSSSTASFPAENLMAPPSVNRDATSHLQFCFRKYLGHNGQESVESKEAELPQIKVEEPEFPQDREREEQFKIKKEKEDVTWSPGESLKRQDDLGRASRKPEPSNTSTWPQIKEEEPEFPQQHKREEQHLIKMEEDVIQSPGSDGLLYEYDDNEGLQKNPSGDKLCKCSLCGKTFGKMSTLKRHMAIHTGDHGDTSSLARQKLQGLLNKNMRIRMTDGRTLVGLFLCTDRDCNVILGSAQEFLKSADTFSQTEPRVLGLAMIPGHHVVSIEAEADILDDAVRH